MEEKAFNKPKLNAYDRFRDLLNNNQIEEYFKDKRYINNTTKEEYQIIKIGESLEDFNLVILVKNLTQNKIQGLKFSDLRNLEEIIQEDNSKTTSE